MVGWHHRFNGHELGQTSGDGEGQGGLVCCSPWGCMTQQLNNNKLNVCKMYHLNSFDIHTSEIISAIEIIIISITLYKVCLYPTVDLPSLLAPLQKISNYSSTCCHYQFQFSGILLDYFFIRSIFVFSKIPMKFTILTIFKVCTPQQH